MKSSEDTLSTIKEVTYRLIAQFGIAGTTYSLIAKEVGIAKPSIYYYFKSKDALIEKIFEELYEMIQFQTFFDVQSFTKKHFVEQLIEVGLTMIDEQDQDPYFNRVLQEYLLLAARNDYYKEKLLTVQQGYLQGFEMLLHQASMFELIPKQNTVAKAHILALVLDNIGNFMMLDEKIDYKQIWIEAVHSIFRGCEKIEE